jgi:D-alanyl-D-alanine dipeptidase
MRHAIVVAVLFVLNCCEGGKELVQVQGIATDIRYATTNNFTNTRLYDEAVCLLRPKTAAKLRAAATEFRQQGFAVKIFDCYRPHSVQHKMWALVPDERYVADPAKGSRHNRGAAVDLTLIRSDGSSVPMPTEYDTFSERAHRDYADLPEDVKRHRALLERVMEQHGFTGLPTEWWHFDDKDWASYGLLDVPLASSAAAVR